MIIRTEAESRGVVLALNLAAEVRCDGPDGQTMKWADMTEGDKAQADAYWATAQVVESADLPLTFDVPYTAMVRRALGEASLAIGSVGGPGYPTARADFEAAKAAVGRS